MKLQIERGANLLALSANSIGNTPLRAAVAGGRVESALALMKTGDVDAPDGGGRTPLRVPAEGGYVRSSRHCFDATPIRTRSTRRIARRWRAPPPGITRR